MAKVPFSKSNKQEEDKTLLEPMLYLLKVPGKNVRKKLLSSFNVWTKVDEDKGGLISESIFNWVPSWIKEFGITCLPQLFTFWMFQIWLLWSRWKGFLRTHFFFHKRPAFLKVERAQSFECTTKSVWIGKSYFGYVYIFNCLNLRFWQKNKGHHVIQSNLAIRNFLVTLKLFLNAKSSLLQTLNQSTI